MSKVKKARDAFIKYGPKYREGPLSTIACGIGAVVIGSNVAGMVHNDPSTKAAPDVNVAQQVQALESKMAPYTADYKAYKALDDKIDALEESMPRDAEGKAAVREEIVKLSTDRLYAEFKMRDSRAAYQDYAFLESGLSEAQYKQTVTSYVAREFGETTPAAYGQSGTTFRDECRVELGGTADVTGEDIALCATGKDLGNLGMSAVGFLGGVMGGSMALSIGFAGLAGLRRRYESDKVEEEWIEEQKVRQAAAAKKAAETPAPVPAPAPKFKKGDALK